MNQILTGQLAIDFGTRESNVISRGNMLNKEQSGS